MARYVAGLAVCVEYWTERGFTPYMVSFMFRLRALDGRFKDQMMRDEICRVYARFTTECLRYPWSEHNRDRKPKLFACPDWAVGKRRKKNRVFLLPDEGPHWGSILLVPPRNRLKTGVKDHFESDRREAYIGPRSPLSRIHVEPISYGVELSTEYVLKSLVRRRCTSDDLLILPWSTSERPQRRNAEAKSAIA